MGIEEKIALLNERHGKMLDTVACFNSVSDLEQPIKNQLANLSRTSTAKKRILVLYYGGTLGMDYESVDGARALVAKSEAEDLLKPLMNQGLEDRMQVVWFPVLGKAIDSTNGRWPHWVSIANAIELLYDEFDGFVVAGGTDTMDYLMASMHFIFPNMGKPIIGAAAQQPIGEWGQDAVRNLGFSLQAATEDISGAHLAFYDKLRHGLHVFKIRDKGYDAFDSPDQYKIGEHVQGDVTLFGKYLRRNEAVDKSNLKTNKKFRDGIEIVRINPFQYADSLLHMSKCNSINAILLTSYGAGNVRDLKMFDNDPTHIEVLEELYNQQFPVILGSPMQDGVVDSPYESGIKAIIEGKVISGGNTTGSTLPIKISRALHNSWDKEKGVDYWKFRKDMYRDHIGEFDERIKDQIAKPHLS